jgi:hypothetical protein
LSIGLPSPQSIVQLPILSGDCTTRLKSFPVQSYQYGAPLGTPKKSYNVGHCACASKDSKHKIMETHVASTFFIIRKTTNLALLNTAEAVKRYSFAAFFSVKKFRFIDEVA